MKSNTPLISIIVPVYKVEPYLNRCIESIVNQTYKNLEIILVDDGSPDNCPAMCDAWAKKDNRIKVFHKPNGGVSSARNDGINKATGTWINFVDSDDYINNDYIESMANLITDETDLVVAGMTIIDDNKNIKSQAPENSNNHDCLNSLDLFMKFFIDGHFSIPVNKLYKKSLITTPFQLGLPLGEDRVFNYNYFKNITQKIATTSNAGYNYIFNSNSACHQKRKNIFDILSVSELALTDFLTFKFNSTYHETYTQMFMLLITLSIRNCDKSELKQLKQKIISYPPFQNIKKFKKPSGFKNKIKFFLIKHKQLKLLKILL